MKVKGLNQLFYGLLLLLACVMKAYGQQPVSRLGVGQGLSNETIRSIYQDSKGFIWFGTLDGLNRYDGYGFKTYRNQFGDSSSLIGNMVSGIAEDKFGNLWLATRQGVSRLNVLQDNFSPVSWQDVRNGKIQRLESEVIKAISVDKSNNVLLATELLGLMICPDATLRATQVPLQDGAVKLYQYGVQAICYDGLGRTLVFVQGRGICQLDYQRQALVLLNDSVKYVNSLLADAGNVWMATNQGVYTYNTASNTISLALSATAGQLNSNLAISLAKDAGGNLWVGTMGGGINIWDKATGRMRYLQGGDGKSDLSSNGIYSLYIDKANRVWAGTQRGGINVIDTRREKFTTTSHEPANPNSLSGNFVTSICELPDSSLLIGTEGSGLNLLDRKTGRFTHFTSNPNQPGSISSNNVNSVATDYLGNIWIATYTDGICRFDKSTGKFIRYTTFNSTTGVENKVLNIFYEDKNKTLWATALRQGNFFGALYRYNRQQDKFELFDASLSDLFILKEDSQGNFWGGNITSLVRIDRSGLKHQSYNIGQFVRTITDDGRGNLWLGTEGGGLVLFDRKTNKIAKRYTTAEGLSNNSILSTLQDNKGRLWLGTFNGLSEFNIKNRSFKNYYRSDGLESDQFHFNAASRLRSGAFAFGGIKGFNVFFPDSIAALAGTPPLHFTGILVDGQPLETEAAFITQTNGSNIAAITVPYSKAVLAFQFAALEYAVPNKILYAYFMEGWDKGWNNAGNTRAATYTHLSEGGYTFKVKSTDGNGIWKEEIALKVIVLPPWYRSWWAYSVYVLLVIGAIYFYLSYRARQARLEYEVGLQKANLSREKAEREKGEAELAREKAEHEREAAELAQERAQRALERSEREAEKVIAEKEREEHERRSAFFTNISHEFRTPLTLIINPVKDLLEKREALPGAAAKDLEIMYRNARRMLSLTNQLLLFRKQESGLDVVRPVPLNLISLCYDAYLCFAQQAKSKNINYLFSSAQPRMDVFADREKLEMIFYNLVSNAMKYTPDGGEVVFSVEEESDTLLVKVSDTGPGIASEAKNHIFDKFYQAKGTGKAVKPGFGIGLYLARQFAAALHGTISVSDRDGGGTEFAVRLQKGSTHFDAGQLAGNVDEAVAGGLLQEMAAREELCLEKSATKYEDASEDTGRLVASDKQAVLLIDDDGSIREYLTLIFKDAYQVYEAPNGETGLILARKILPDIIISDIMMGQVSGIELCSAIKEDPSLSHIPVILLTGTSSEELKLEGVKGGADDYIQKPFDKELLMARVSNLLKSRNALQKYFYNEITLNRQDAKISEQYRQFLESCIRIVEEHLGDDDFNIKKLASEIGMSYSSVTKKIKAVSGQSLNGFVRFIRLRKAARLFIDTNYNVNEVATMVGIFDARYFREQFSKLFGIKPSEYIKKYRQPFANKFSVNKDALEGGV